jgi:hypothetical protein
MGANAPSLVAHKGLASSPRSSRKKARRIAKRGGVLMTDHAVIIAGGGATGLMLGGRITPACGLHPMRAARHKPWLAQAAAT